MITCTCPRLLKNTELKQEEPLPPFLRTCTHQHNIPPFTTSCPFTCVRTRLLFPDLYDQHWLTHPLCAVPFGRWDNSTTSLRKGGGLLIESSYNKDAHSKPTNAYAKPFQGSLFKTSRNYNYCKTLCAKKTCHFIVQCFTQAERPIILISIETQCCFRANNVTRLLTRNLLMRALRFIKNPFLQLSTACFSESDQKVGADCRVPQRINCPDSLWCPLGSTMLLD